MSTHNETDLRQRIVDPMLRKAKWTEDNILLEPVFHYNGQILRPDYVLTTDAYPLAVIETKSTSGKQKAIIQQVANYRVALHVPFAFVILGSKIYQLDPIDETLIELDRFPSEAELKDSIKFRIPSTQEPKIKNLHQMRAIASVLDAIIKEQKRILVVMATGSGKHLTQVKIISKLIAFSQKARILIISDRQEIQSQYVRSLESANLRCSILQKIQDYTEGDSIHLITSTALGQQGKNSSDIFQDAYNYIFWDDIRRSDSIKSAINLFPSSVFVAFANSIDMLLPEVEKIFGTPVSVYSFSDAVEQEILTPPAGFQSIRARRNSFPYSWADLFDIKNTRNRATWRKSSRSDSKDQ